MSTNPWEERLKALEKDLALAAKQYGAAAEERRTTLDPGNRVLLDAQVTKWDLEMERLYQECEDVKRKLLQGGDTYRDQALAWEQNLPNMDYHKARKIAEDVLTRFEDREGAVLFMLQRSHLMCGEWCLAALREMVDKGNGKFIPREVKFTLLDRPSEIELLNKLGRCLNATIVKDDIATSITAVINKLYDAVQSGGTVFVSIEFADGQIVSPTFFKWFVEEFWCALIKSSIAAAEKCELFKVIIAIVVNSSLPDECIQAYLGSLDATFDFRKMLELPLENWTSEDIRKWLVYHSGLALERDEVKQVARTIYTSSQDGMPRMAYSWLLKNIDDLDKSKPKP